MPQISLRKGSLEVRERKGSNSVRPSWSGEWLCTPLPSSIPTSYWVRGTHTSQERDNESWQNLEVRVSTHTNHQGGHCNSPEKRTRQSQRSTAQANLMNNKERRQLVIAKVEAWMKEKAPTRRMTNSGALVIENVEYC